jgi:hypothetical protein
VVSSEEMRREENDRAESETIPDSGHETELGRSGT